jgi:hypothetical protein
LSRICYGVFDIYVLWAKGANGGALTG